MISYTKEDCEPSDIVMERGINHGKIAVIEDFRLFDAIQAVDELYLPVEKGNEVEFGLYSADAKGAS